LAAIGAYLGTQLALPLIAGLVLLGAGSADPLLVDPTSGGPVLLALVVLSQVAGLVVVLMLLRRRGVVLAEVVGPLRPVARHVGIGVGLGLVALIGSTLLVSLLVTLSGSEATPEQVLTEGIADTPVALLLAALAAVVMAPIAEELLFRGLLHRGLRQRMRRPSALVLSSVLFAVVHVDVAASQPLALVGLTFVGVVLALAHERTGSLLVPVVIHATHNALTLLAVVVTSRFEPGSFPGAGVAGLLS
jgi:membrane protease YdiL (CAAX protease family)